MISIVPRTSLAESLFQYCFGRILAERFRYNLDGGSIRGFPRTSTLIQGEKIPNPEVRWEGEWPTDSRTGVISEEELLRAPNRKILLAGTFRRFELYAENREQIRNDWLMRSDGGEDRPSSDFVVCLRHREDLFPLEDFRRLTRVVKYKHLFVVADKLDHLALDGIKDLRPILYNGGDFETIRFVSSFKKIAFNASSLFWWAAFLSNADEIFFAEPRRAINVSDVRAQINSAKSREVDLRVDENRYVYSW